MKIRLQLITGVLQIIYCKLILYYCGWSKRNPWQWWRMTRDSDEGWSIINDSPQVRVHRPVIVSEVQPWSRVEDLVSQSLVTHKFSLPSYLITFCRHRGDVTVSSMQKEMTAMGKHIRKQDLEVNNLVFLINVIYILMFDWIYDNTHIVSLLIECDSTLYW